MRNVTITLDEETALWARVEAAKADTSVSRFVGGMLRRQMEHGESFDAAQARYLARAASNISKGAGYPSRDDLHAR